VLVDDSSRNGSYVNDERVTDESALNDGDVLRFGDTVVRFRAPADAAVPLDSEESGSLPRPTTQG
jgi:pSer/pThr/pTyr-binding forkhead associated (FHA) protein